MVAVVGDAVVGPGRWCPVAPGEVPVRIVVDVAHPAVAARGTVDAVVPVPPGASVTVSVPLAAALDRLGPAGGR